MRRTHERNALIWAVTRTPGDRLLDIIAWVTLGTIILLVVGCGSSPTSPEATTEVEAALISETARFAGQLYVNVHGEITDRDYYVTKEVKAVGWYDAGVAYYNRKMVAQYVVVSLGAPHNYPWENSVETAENIAAHEVCHSMSYQHDLLHWTCSQKIATPTYPRPGSSSSHVLGCAHGG